VGQPDLNHSDPITMQETDTATASQRLRASVGPRLLSIRISGTTLSPSMFAAINRRVVR
jgi:hypothetical protein